MTTANFSRQIGPTARAMADVQHHKPEHGEARGKISCPRCRGRLNFTIMSNGLSRGQCTSAGCLRWCQ